MRKISRLPRRFDATMKTLRALMNSKSERVRLAAVLRTSEILLEHQRGEERAAVAVERAQARRAEAEAAGDAEEVSEVQQTQVEALDALLARINAGREKGGNNE